jgi:hypothetical protein
LSLGHFNFALEFGRLNRQRILESENRSSETADFAREASEPIDWLRNRQNIRLKFRLGDADSEVPTFSAFGEVSRQCQKELLTLLPVVKVLYSFLDDHCEH